VAMADVIRLANSSPARERIIILDCCHSGTLGTLPELDNSALLNEGVSILAACRNTEFALEQNGAGLFTTLVCDAISGGAADVCGKVSVASIYAYADEALSEWDQRPLLKAHVSRLVPIRKCEPAVPLDVLRRLPQYFPNATDSFPLDPSYEPEARPEHQEHQVIFEHLQCMNRARLIIPVDAPHMYLAAIESKACKLTALGRFYWHCVQGGKI